MVAKRKDRQNKESRSPPSPIHVPERATYGFVSYLLCYISFGIFLIWAYTPYSYLEWIGLTYWPSKFLAVAIPPFLCVLFLGSFVFYEGLIFTNTAPVDSPSTVSDSKKVDYKHLPKDAITPIEELSICDVNKALYGT
ncbi:phosphatidylinositol N-acetylglucosaminyltransferase subunit P-like [Saccostrea cucullata]|uniref:phosphatidylinositol N-acetylglucosaminyltransferase subunit P-like n=1 Tax=Saccostrea cuccullata TaxID=36930 RepID=UPI002ED3E5C9